MPPTHDDILQPLLPPSTAPRPAPYLSMPQAQPAPFFAQFLTRSPVSVSTASSDSSYSGDRSSSPSTTGSSDDGAEKTSWWKTWLFYCCGCCWGMCERDEDDWVEVEDRSSEEWIRADELARRVR